MDRRPLGKTGLQLTPIGFGAFKIGRNEGIKYPSQYDLPDERTATDLLNTVLDLGINYIDTAPAYGVSEERIGRAIGHRREDVILGTKVGETFTEGRSMYDFTASAIRAGIQRSLRRLRTDRIDIVFVHAHGSDVAILEETDVAATLQSMRDEGSVRAIGFSGKTTAAAALAITWADVLMIEYHLEDDSHADVMRQAARSGLGVIIKKGLASGRLPPETAIPHILRNPDVTSLVIGTLRPEHLRDAIRLADQA